MKRKWISPIVPNLMPHSSKLQVPRKTLTVLNQAENIDTLVRRTVVERESPPVPSTTHLQCAYYAKFLFFGPQLPVETSLDSFVNTGLSSGLWSVSQRK